MTYAVFAIAADSDQNVNVDAAVTKVAAYNATAVDSNDSDDSNNVIVANMSNVESDSNAVVTVVISSNSKFSSDLQN